MKRGPLGFAYFIFGLFLSLVTFFPASARAQSLLTNGSFEIDSAPTLLGGLFGNGAGWDSSYISFFGPAAFPDSYLSFTRIPAQDGFKVQWMPPGTSIFQTVSLTAGSSYLLSFFTTPDTGATANTTLLATIAGGNQNFSSDFNVIRGSSVWTHQQLTFTASSSGSYTVTFFASNGGGNTLYLDSVSLTSIPEPSTTRSLLLGACALGIAKWRRRSE